MIVIWVWLVAFMGYLLYKVAYNQGRKDKWKELCEDYVCIHKSVGIKFGYMPIKRNKKNLTKKEIKDIMKTPTKKRS